MPEARRPGTIPYVPILAVIWFLGGLTAMILALLASGPRGADTDYLSRLLAHHARGDYQSFVNQGHSLAPRLEEDELMRLAATVMSRGARRGRDFDLWVMSPLVGPLEDSSRGAELLGLWYNSLATWDRTLDLHRRTGLVPPLAHAEALARTTDGLDPRLGLDPADGNGPLSVGTWLEKTSTRLGVPELKAAAAGLRALQGRMDEALDWWDSEEPRDFNGYASILASLGVWPEVWPSTEVLDSQGLMGLIQDRLRRGQPGEALEVLRRRVNLDPQVLEDPALAYMLWQNLRYLEEVLPPSTTDTGPLPAWRDALDRRFRASPPAMDLEYHERMAHLWDRLENRAGVMDDWLLLGWHLVVNRDDTGLKRFLEYSPPGMESWEYFYGGFLAYLENHREMAETYFEAAGDRGIPAGYHNASTLAGLRGATARSGVLREKSLRRSNFLSLPDHEEREP